MKLYLGRRPSVYPAQGTALGSGGNIERQSAQRANRSPEFAENRWAVGPIVRYYAIHEPQGIALGWGNGRPFGANNRTPN